MVLAKAVWLWATIACAASRAGLELIKRCGELSCSVMDYCSDGRCLPCSDKCSRESHNYSPEICQESCQDYIHDEIRHYLKGDTQKATRELQETLEWLRGLVALSVTLSCLVALAFCAFIGFFWLKHRRNSEIKQRTALSVICNNNDSVVDTKDKTLSVVEPVVGSASNITSTTPLSTRHPSEDATLEGFGAYDNPGLSPSPNQIPRHETTF